MSYRKVIESLDLKITPKTLTGPAVAYLEQIYGYFDAVKEGASDQLTQASDLLDLLGDHSDDFAAIVALVPGLGDRLVTQLQEEWPDP